jgi:nucleoside-diphosphate-sugar epimerase
MKALVTGATGLIGSHLAEALVSHGIEVRVLVRPTSDLRDIKHLDVDVCHGDVRDPDSLRRATRGVEIVFHTAARMNDWGPWEEFFRDNVQGVRNLLEAANESNVHRFVHVSSTGVVGLGAFLDAREETPYDGEGNYERSKVESEQIALEYGKTRGLPVTVIRPCWTLGPRARRHIPLLITYLVQRKLIVAGTGRNILNFVDPRDAAEAMILASMKPVAVGQIYNVTNGSRTDRQIDLYRILAEELGVKPPRLYAPWTLGVVIGRAAEAWATARRWEDAPMITPIRSKFLGRNRHFSCEKARRELGYQPRFTLRQSLRDAVSWYRAAGEPPPAK